MAARRGYRPPGDYDPRRGKKGKRQGGPGGGARGDTGRGSAGQDRRSGGASAGDRAARSSQQSEPNAARHEDRTDELQTRPWSGISPDAGGQPRGEISLAGRSLEATRTRPEDVADLTFAQLGLGGNIVRALGELGADRPFAIQAATIPDVLAGHHLLGRARTGSGKTIAFGAALVERLMLLRAEGAFPNEKPKERPKRGERAARPNKQSARAPKALILAPTRELALQIDRTVQPIARSVGLFTGQFVGGQPFEPQLHALGRGVDIAIGTPGRIEDLAKRDHLSLGQIAITVIDEADHMAELGFIEPVQRILRQTRRGGQRLLFSATLDRGVDGLVREFMPRPAIHEIASEGELGTDSDTPGDWKPQPNVSHRVFVVLREHKDEVLVQLASRGLDGAGAGRTVIFCRTRAYAEMVTELLTEAGVRAISLHGDLSQARRERNLAKFIEGKADVLVATDVAARGLHVDDIDLVLQADPPGDPKAYVHRAGRTGRVGRAGSVITLITRTRQRRTLELFEALGFEPEYFGDFVPGAAG